jgi:DNA topoisomerase-2
MPMWNLTQEKKDDICKKRDEKQKDLRTLQATTKEDMWRTDLDDFIAKLDEVILSISFYLKQFTLTGGGQRGEGGP